MSKFIVLNRLRALHRQTAAFFAALLIVTTPGIGLSTQVFAEPIPASVNSSLPSQESTQSNTTDASLQSTQTIQPSSVSDNQAASTPTSPVNDSPTAPVSKNSIESVPTSGPISQTPENITPTTTPGTSSSNTSAQLDNTLNASSQSGTVDATSNTTIGNITTGNSSVSTTTANVLQSSVQVGQSSQPILFNYDINGSLNGNLILDPSVLSPSSSYGPLSMPQADTSPLSVDASTQAAILNSINLSAQSGDAKVTKNSNTGNILTGDANAVANVLNIVSSGINANQVFIGSINIYGDLTGDILIPEQFVSTILGASQAPVELLNGGANTFVVSDMNSSITNSITANAQSGNVIAANNSATGDISTGQSQTNINTLNLIGQQISTDNVLLIFINVLGTWVGVLFNAQPGTTSSVLSSNSASALSSDPIAALAAQQNNTFAINNDINLSAQSGNAKVVKNSQTGNIQTGNATASANILNILNSHISLSQWFGILFINVFGTWKGNFAVDPTAKTSQDQSAPTLSGQPPTNNYPTPNSHLFSAGVSTALYPSDRGQYTAVEEQQNTPTVSGESIETVSQKIPETRSGDHSSTLGFSEIMLALALFLIASIFATRYYSQRRNNG